jgi:hypothetical protein
MCDLRATMLIVGRLVEDLSEAPLDLTHPLSSPAQRWRVQTPANAGGVMLERTPVAIGVIGGDGSSRARGNGGCRFRALDFGC